MTTTSGMIRTLGKCEKHSDSIFTSLFSNQHHWYEITLYLNETTNQLYYQKVSDATGKVVLLFDYIIHIPVDHNYDRKYIFILKPVKESYFLGSSTWYMSLPDEDSFLTILSTLQGILDAYHHQNPENSNCSILITGNDHIDSDDEMMTETRRNNASSTATGAGESSSSAMYWMGYIPTIGWIYNTNSSSSTASSTASDENKDEKKKQQTTAESNTTAVTSNNESKETDPFLSFQQAITDSMKQFQQKVDTLLTPEPPINKFLLNSPFNYLHRRLCEVLPMYRSMNDTIETQTNRRLINWIISIFISVIVYFAPLDNPLYYTNIALMIYPIYGSIYAIEYKLKDELLHWLTYWILFAFFLCMDILPAVFLSFFVYLFMKVHLLIDCMAGDAKRNYEEGLRPFIIVFDWVIKPKIAQKLKEAETNAVTAITTSMKAKKETTTDDPLEKMKEEFKKFESMMKDLLPPPPPWVTKSSKNNDTTADDDNTTKATTGKKVTFEKS